MRYDNAKLEAFAAFYNDLMLAPSGLSKLEREMIAVAVSSENRCYYCLTAHGAAVRQLSGDPALGEMMVMNFRAADLSSRHRAMLEFAVKLTERLARDRRGRPGGAAQPPASANATSGTSPRGLRSSTCRTAWPRPSTCGRTPNTTPWLDKGLARQRPGAGDTLPGGRRSGPPDIDGVPASPAPCPAPG